MQPPPPPTFPLPRLPDVLPLLCSVFILPVHGWNVGGHAAAPPSHPLNSSQRRVDRILGHVSLAGSDSCTTVVVPVHFCLTRIN
jgi:hypothetical protein